MNDFENLDFSKLNAIETNIIKFDNSYYFGKVK